MIVSNKYNFKYGIPLEYQKLFNTPFVSENITNYILKNTHTRSVINNDKYIITTFITDDSLLENDIYDIRDRTEYFLKCVNVKSYELPVKIFWFPTPFKKVLPNDKLTLDVNEINSACTFFFGNIPSSFIVIYRFEEAKKVLFHELAHLFNLEDGISYKYEMDLRNRYNLRPELPCSLRETYSELIGCLLNIYYLSKGDSTLFKQYLILEQVFSIYQIRKIFNFFNINNVSELHKLTSDTNLMTYYILKGAILLHRDIEVLFKSLLMDNLKLKDDNLKLFIKYLYNLEHIPKYFKYIKKLHFDNNTMRMTLIQ
jgi:hypothetical protein